MATESSNLLGTASNNYSRPSINNADPEVETSLSSTLGTNSRHSAHRVTIDELHGLLEALDNARSAVQAQLDARMSKTGGRPKPLIPHWITKYLLLITFLGQPLHMIAHMVLCSPVFDYWTDRGDSEIGQEN